LTQNPRAKNRRPRRKDVDAIEELSPEEKEELRELQFRRGFPAEK
jgi:hypothetical protein